MDSIVRAVVSCAVPVTRYDSKLRAREDESRPKDGGKWMELNEQVAYLRGLIEGQEFGGEKDMILWEQVLNLFDLVSVEISNLKDQDDDLEEYVEAIDEDLGYLEERYCPVGDAEEDTDYESAELNS